MGGCCFGSRLESKGETVFGILVAAGTLVVGTSGNGRVVVEVGRRKMWKRITDNFHWSITISTRVPTIH